MPISSEQFQEIINLPAVLDMIGGKPEDKVARLRSIIDTALTCGGGSAPYRTQKQIGTTPDAWKFPIMEGVTVRNLECRVDACAWREALGECTLSLGQVRIMERVLEITGSIELGSFFDR